MYAFAVSIIAVGALGIMTTIPASGKESNGASVVLVQGGTGAGAGSQGLGTGKSGSGKETDVGRGTLGKKSEFGEDQPRQGDFSPNAPAATGSQPKPSETDKTIAGSEQPPGIGEKGSGQTRSTTERSGGPQPSASESMAKSSIEHGEGKTERAAKDLKSQKPSNR
jgi:hypothetical protein